MAVSGTPSIRDDGSSSHWRLQNLQEMSIQQTMHFESGLLSVDASGEFSLDDAKQAFLEML